MGTLIKNRFMHCNRPGRWGRELASSPSQREGKLAAPKEHLSSPEPLQSVPQNEFRVSLASLLGESQ